MKKKTGYCRAQTVLSLEQNLKDTDEIKKKVFLKIIRIIERTIGSNCFVLWLKDLFLSNNKFANLFLTKMLLKDKRTEPDQIKLPLL